MTRKKSHKVQPPRASWDEIMKRAAQEPGVPAILKLLESQRGMPDPADRSTAAYPDLPPASRTSTVC